MKLWIGGDGECPVYILTESNQHPKTYDTKKRDSTKDFPFVYGSLYDIEITEHELLTLKKFNIYVYDQR